MPTTLQLLAVSSLICECEKLTSSGELPEPVEQSLRIRIAGVLSAFNIPAQFDRQQQAAE